MIAKLDDKEEKDVIQTDGINNAQSAIKWLRINFGITNLREKLVLLHWYLGSLSVHPGLNLY